NFFYLSGWPEPGAALLIAASPEHPYTEILFLPDHNPSQEKWTGPKLGPENTDAAKITGFERVVALDNLRSELVRLLPAPKTTIYTDIPAGEKVSNSTSPLDWLKRGCEHPAYAPIVGSGFDSTVLHYSQDSEAIRDGDVVLIDAAGEYSLYASDITRTLPASGKFTARQREIYDIVLGAQRAAIAA